MNFNKHLEYEQKHAFLSPSGYHWINYDDEKLIGTYKRKMAALKGTELHEFAAQAIKLKQKFAKTHQTLNLYVNDAIGFGLSPEVLLYYSPFCFGTADAIGLKKNVLRVHDLKTGENDGHMEQLYVYVALFCLEYHYKPNDFDDIVTRIYQFDDYVEDHPTAQIIVPIMDKIVHHSKILMQICAEEGGSYLYE